MKYYAKVDRGIVINVIMAEPEFFDTFVDDIAGDWIETCPNGSIRKNYAGKGYAYNSSLDAFVPPKPYDDWILNEETANWESPISQPEDRPSSSYRWDTESNDWILK
jgi:hypothetical protein